MSGDLFEDRNWLPPPNYLNNDCKNATSPKSPIIEEPKTGEESISLNAEKCGWGPNCPFCKNQEKEGWDGKYQSQPQQKVPPPRHTKTLSKMSSNPELSEAPKHTEV